MKDGLLGFAILLVNISSGISVGNRAFSVPRVVELRQFNPQPSRYSTDPQGAVSHTNRLSRLSPNSCLKVNLCTLRLSRITYRFASTASSFNAY